MEQHDRLALPVSMTLAIAACTAHADLPVYPMLVVQEGADARLVGVEAQAQGGPPDFQTRTPSNTGPFVLSLDAQAFGLGGASATGSADQDSVISTYSIRGKGSVSADATGSPEAPATGRGDSVLQVTFSVPVDADFFLSATLDTDAPPGGAPTIASLTFTGTDADGDPIIVSGTSGFINGFTEENVVELGRLQAGAQQMLTVMASSQAANGLGGSASFEVTFDVGDEDGDGLLDEWEMNQGIDVDNDQIVDIPLDGADPFHKDIFVEYDVMAGRAPAAGALSDVVNAFAQAPADLVDNPDGTGGVTLHFVDGQDEIAPALSPWGTGFAEFDAVKMNHFGLPSERPPAEPDDDRASDLRDARLLSHHYLVFAHDAMSAANEPVLGRGEIPGNDLFVCVDAVESLANQHGALRDFTAYTVMHELGHNLGLRHGGADNINFKPNYISVMNYWIIPAPGWALAYSPSALPPLDEEDLDESVGVQATAPEYAGRGTLWNSAPPGDPAQLEYTRNLNQIDWNQQDGIETDIETLDLNYGDQSGAAIGSPGQTLVGHCDWNGRWYHLSGFQTYDDAAVRPPETVPDEPGLPTIEAIVETANAAACPPDFDGNGSVDTTDLGALLTAWGQPGPTDLNGNGATDTQDLGMLITAWGDCDN